MSADIAHTLRPTTHPHEAGAQSAARTRARIVLALGPLAIIGRAGLGADPALAADAAPPGAGRESGGSSSSRPLYVALVGVLFRWLLAPGLVADLYAANEEDGRVIVASCCRRRSRPLAVRDRLRHARPAAARDEAIVGEEVWARRPWRRYLWPALLFAMGVLHVARDDLLHELDDPHARPRRRGRR